ncbi:class I adenylate-forming enzyme family protein [Paenibacillus yanchengensis]|uniref:Class I adenylate-forming enzyme family protein n=1 Tax=Paenibacillus yanchengensis TaxID=2035833 RepID=A0ABW4YLS4_9BACL
MTIYMIQDILAEAAESNPMKIGFQTENHSFTYSQILQQSIQMAEFLKSKGVRKGTHIGLHLNNEEYFIFSLFGGFLLDCVIVPIPYFSTDAEIEQMIINCDVSFCITTRMEITNNISITNIIWISYDKMSHNPTTDLLFDTINKSKDGQQLAMLLSTSGSTDKPKIVMLSHDNVVSSAISHGERIAYTHSDVFLITMPVHFSSTIVTQIISCIYLNTKFCLVMLPLMSRAMITYMRRFEISAFSCVPTMIISIVTEMERTLISPFDQIKTIVVSGAALHNETLMKASYYFPSAQFIQTYGLTEAAPRVSMMNRTDNYLSSGNTVDGVVLRIVEEIGVGQVDQKIGEIWVKGRNIMQGYYRDPLTTKQVISDGWLRTGDLGYLDENDRLHIVGRKKNIIIVGGNNVYPEEIEEGLGRIHQIEEVIVVGEKDEILGEVPVSYIKLKKGTSLVASEIRRYCQVYFSNYKIPRKFYFVDHIPKTNTGKLDRTKIKQICKKNE